MEPVVLDYQLGLHGVLFLQALDLVWGKILVVHTGLVVAVLAVAHQVHHKLAVMVEVEVVVQPEQAWQEPIFVAQAAVVAVLILLVVKEAQAL
jgi:hypothetical protein